MLLLKWKSILQKIGEILKEKVRRRSKLKKEQMNIRNEREKLQEKMKKQKIREKGITLIALVVTIINGYDKL